MCRRADAGGAGAYAHRPMGTLLRSPTVLKLAKYSTASVAGVLVGQATLIFALEVLGWAAMPANLASVTLGCIPNYTINRYWTWQQSGENRLWGEVVPFWSMAILGALLSMLAVAYADRTWGGTFAVAVANLSGFAVLWVAKFFVLDKLMWKVVHDLHPDVDIDAAPAGQPCVVPWPSMSGRRPRQAATASASPTSSWPSTTSRSPPASPTTLPSTPAAPWRRCSSPTAAGSTASTTRLGDSANSQPWPAASGAWTRKPVPPDTAISASARPSPPSAASCTPSTSPSCTSPITSSHRARWAWRSRAGGVPRLWPRSQAQREPDNVRGSGPSTTTCVPSTSRTPGGGAARSSISPTTATTGVGSMSRPRLSL